MKKFVALLLAAMMLLAMVACGNDPQPTPEPDPTPEPRWLMSSTLHLMPQWRSS